MDARVKMLIEVMRDSLLSDFSIGMLSKSVNLSPSGLRRLFKEEMGSSPIQYVKALRMRHAEQLLRDTFLSVKEVAFRSGGKDVSYFSREFKKQYGLTPTDFRHRVRSSLDNSKEATRLANSLRDGRLRRLIPVEETDPSS